MNAGPSTLASAHPAVTTRSIVSVASARAIAASMTPLETIQSVISAPMAVSGKSG
jgi:hypothetical protein